MPEDEVEKFAMVCGAVAPAPCALTAAAGGALQYANEARAKLKELSSEQSPHALNPQRCVYALADRQRRTAVARARQLAEYGRKVSMLADLAEAARIVRRRSAPRTSFLALCRVFA